MTDQAIQELSTSVDKLKDEVRKAREEAERWKIKAEEAGVDTSDGITLGADTQRGR